MLNIFIQKFSFFVVLTFALFSSAFAKDYQVEDQPWVLEFISEIPQKGILKQKANGYVYVEVSNEFIAQSLNLIETTVKIAPSGHYTKKNGIGAHISVLTEGEQETQEIWEISELGQEVDFTVLELRTVKVRTRNKLKKLWLIAVASPALEKLRENYGLSPKLQNHDFHITIGTQTADKPTLKTEDSVPEEKQELQAV